MNNQKKTSRDGIGVVRSQVAGVDIGSEEHWVAGPPDAELKPNVKRFGTTSEQLEALCTWLENQKVESVAMESTGVYWIPLYELLESRGIEVMLVNARDFHHAPGRPKTDRLDCQWLQKLHSCGMLRGSFRPHESFIPLRTLYRQRSNLVYASTRFIQWMQKSLDQMNVQVHHAVSDITGVTGLSIVRAIVAGERSPEKLAALRDPRCKKSVAEIAKCLTGTWREEHLFNLASALRQYDANEAEIALFDAEISRRLDALQIEKLKEQSAPNHPKAGKQKQMRKDGVLPLRDQLWRATGVDLTRIDGISTAAAQVILSEVGMDLSAFPDERHFVSWLRLCPPTKISGGKPLKSRTRNGMSANRISSALRMAAVSIAKTKTALGAHFRRISRTKAHDVAVFATARRLAQYVYRLLRFGQEYVDIGETAAEAQYEARRLKSLTDAAKAQGFALVPIAQ